MIIAQLNWSLWKTVNGPYHRAYAQWTCLCPSTTLTFFHSSIPDSIDTRYIKRDGWDRHKTLTVCSQFPFGSFRVRSTNFWLNLQDPPPILMKVGTLADNAWKKICTNFQRCRSSGFRYMTFQKIEKGSIFATRPVSQMPITFFY